MRNRGRQDEFPDFGFSVFRQYWALKPFEITRKAFLELLLDVPRGAPGGAGLVPEVLEVVLEVHDQKQHVLKTPCV